MLRLEPEDLSEGLLLWHRRRVGSTGTTLCAAWSDLVLVSPALTLPEECRARQQAGWRDGVRATWHDGLFRYLYLVGAPVPDLSPAEAAIPAAVRATLRRRAKRADVLDGSGAIRGTISRAAFARMRSAVADSAKLLGEVGGRPTLLAVTRGSRLRAVAAIRV